MRLISVHLTLPSVALTSPFGMQYVCHAEMNAVLNKNTANLKGCRIYVALFPCNECTKLIIQSGITEVVYYSDKYHHTYVAAYRAIA